MNNTIPPAMSKLLDNISHLRNAINETEDELKNIENILEAPSRYEISISVYLKGIPDANRTPKSINELDVIPVIEVAKERYTQTLEELKLGLRFSIAKLKEEVL